MINVIAIDDIDKLIEKLEDIKNNLSGGGSGGGLPDYSTTEKKTGQKWIDGKDVYFKVVQGDLNNATVTIPNTLNIEELIDFSGWVYSTEQYTYYRLYIPRYETSTRKINISKTSNGIAITSGNDIIANYNKYTMILYYTKA